MFSTTLFDRYILKNLLPALIFTAVTLAAIILLTQSLRFLELIMNSGASSLSFWILTFLALPRFFEVILPIAMMIAVLFTYNRMSSDSEIVVMRAAGKSPMQLAKPAITLSVLTVILLLFITAWLAPTSLSNMQQMRQVIKAQYSTLLFREGIFNEIGDDLMVYIDNRNLKGELEGLLIHDSRDENPTPVTILAKRGVIVATDTGQQVLVYDGSRQDLNPNSGALNRLDFDRYTIDLPESGAVRQRDKDPSERTIFELMNPNLDNIHDQQNLEEFKAEIHRRIIGPFLAISFTGVALCFLLLGQTNRRGQAKRIFSAVVSIIILQGLYLGTFNMATEGRAGLILFYAVVLIPIVLSFFLLSHYGERLRHKFLYKQKLSSVNKAEGETL